MVVDHAHVSPGQTVIVHGAHGNVRAFAAKIASWIGATVIGSARDHQADLKVRGFGASNTFAMNTQAASQFLGSADVLIDTVGGASQPALIALVKPGGLLISCVSKPDPALGRNRHIRVDYLIVDVNTEAFDEIAKLVAAGRVNIHESTMKPAGKIILCSD